MSPPGNTPKTAWPSARRWTRADGLEASPVAASAAPAPAPASPPRRRGGTGSGQNAGHDEDGGRGACGTTGHGVDPQGCVSVNGRPPGQPHAASVAARTRRRTQMPASRGPAGRNWLPAAKMRTLSADTNPCRQESHSRQARRRTMVHTKQLTTAALAAAVLIVAATETASAQSVAHRHIGHVGDQFNGTPDKRPGSSLPPRPKPRSPPSTPYSPPDPGTWRGFSATSCTCCTRSMHPPPERGPGRGYGLVRAASGCAQHIRNGRRIGRRVECRQDPFHPRGRQLQQRRGLGREHRRKGRDGRERDRHGRRQGARRRDRRHGRGHRFGNGRRRQRPRDLAGGRGRSWSRPRPISGS